MFDQEMPDHIRKELNKFYIAVESRWTFNILNRLRTNNLALKRLTNKLKYRYKKIENLGASIDVLTHCVQHINNIHYTYINYTDCIDKDLEANLQNFSFCNLCRGMASYLETERTNDSIRKQKLNSKKRKYGRNQIKAVYVDDYNSNSDLDSCINNEINGGLECVIGSSLESATSGLECMLGGSLVGDINSSANYINNDSFIDDFIDYNKFLDVYSHIDNQPINSAILDNKNVDNENTNTVSEEKTRRSTKLSHDLRLENYLTGYLKGYNQCVKDKKKEITSPLPNCLQVSMPASLQILLDAIEKKHM
jgi:hypothetical protein